MPMIPIINKSVDLAELSHSITSRYDALYEYLQDEKYQRKLVLVIVAIALLLDNMLYMVIVPIIPPYLEKLERAEQDAARKHIITNGTTTPRPDDEDMTYEGEGSAVGVLFASKAAIQLLVGPFSGAIIDRVGYDKPMMVGLTIMFFSTALFACGDSYGMLFFARSLQGVGSAFADTAGLAMIADRFTEENERQKALGIALAFISFGCLVAPPFGGSLYGWFGKELPFLILAFVCLIDGLLLVFVMRPVKAKLKEAGYERPPGTPIWRLFMDPQILVCAGALTMANVSLAFLEPTISMWMEKEMGASSWEVGMIWLPAFIPHVLGVILTVKLANKYPHRQYIYALIGLVMEGASCLFIPLIDTYYVLILPLCSICFGVALIDTALLPTLGFLVDLRYVSVYGSIYAIADISYSVAYAFGPVIAGSVVESIGFTALNLMIAFSNFLYAPALLKLRHIYDYKPFEEGNVLMSNDPNNPQYQSMAEGPKMQFSQLEQGDNASSGGGMVEPPRPPPPVPPGPSNLNRTHFGNVNGHVRFDERGQMEQQPAAPQPAGPPYDNAPVRGENPYNPFRQGGFGGAQ
ncbi:unnamed protein product [Notodromas monacha]|uniref:Major facilitator superfamily (MFS) profile domain-containing protein n=1 Tax=Notodromas monacha TaxID=399045 RepID=A0A7R9G9I8_9CRUS|nr:unnamed protein product [Notodromas monacha]CAG0914257.1 unnamed protein product [Notodromas monacha]